MVQVEERVERAPVSSPPPIPALLSPERRDQLIFLALLALGLLLRLHELGQRAYHHDESLHATYSWYLYSGRGYEHHPMMHGPLQFHLIAFIFFLFGDSDVTGRLGPVLFGLAMIGLPYFLRHELGRTAAVVAAALFTISPTFLYFSRFSHDIYVSPLTLLMVVGLFGYLRTREAKYLYVGATGLALEFATKEVVYINVFIFLSFFVLVSAFRRFIPQGDLVWQAIRGLPPAAVARSLLIFVGVYVVLFTTFFTNLGDPWNCLRGEPCKPGGLVSGSVGALQYWFEQHGVQRGGQPWFYYGMLVLLYEFLPLVLAIGMVIKGPKDLFTRFTIYWLLAAVVIYSWAGEKMPWLVVQLVMPMILVAARGLANWIEHLRPGEWRSPPTLQASGLWLLMAACAVALLTVNAVQWLDVIDRQALGLEKLALLLAITGGAVGLWWMGRRDGSRTLRISFGLSSLLIGLMLYLHVGWMVTYAHGDIPVEMLVYVQSSPDVVWVSREIERIGYQTGQGKDLRILMDNGFTDMVGGQQVVHEAISWPFEWYLRHYRNRRYYSRTLGGDINLRDYPVILAMAPNVEPIRPLLGDYTGQKYKLNWWYPEDYKGLSPQVIWDGLMDAETRGKVLKYVLYRETLNQLGAREFYFYVRKDIPGLGPAPGAVAAAPAVPVPPAAVAPQPGSRATILGRLGVDSAGQPQLSDPKDVAVDAAGRVYTVEARANRISVLQRDGALVGGWGSGGTGDGEFNEPWGIAVAPDGEVYVADTWNHRIQRFDSEGRFLGKWGVLGDTQGQTGAGLGLFWGPRDVAIGADNRVYVTDTGNKRIQVFDRAGAPLGAIGGEGTAPGRLREPVGLVSEGASLWVVDTWNNRLQQLASDGTAQLSVPVPGWEGQSITNKPYLAIAPGGQILVSVPDAGLLYVVDRTGPVRAIPLGEPGPRGAIQPTGIAIDSSGEIYVSDSRNGAILRLARVE